VQPAKHQRGSTVLAVELCAEHIAIEGARASDVRNHQQVGESHAVLGKVASHDATISPHGAVFVITEVRRLRITVVSRGHLPVESDRRLKGGAQAEQGNGSAAPRRAAMHFALLVATTPAGWPSGR